MPASHDFATFAQELDYPIRKEKLIEQAERRGFDADQIRRVLETTPTEEFNSPNNVTEAFAKASFPGA